MCRRPINTKLDKVVTTVEGSHPINSHELLTLGPTWGHVEYWKNYLQPDKTYGHETWQGVDFKLEAQNTNVS